MSLGAVRVSRMLTKTLHIDNPLAASANVNRSWRQVAKHVEVALKDRIDAVLDGTVLLEGLSLASLDHERDKFFNVGLLDLLFSSTLAELDLITVGKRRREC